MYNKLQETLKFIKGQFKDKVDVGIILGSGLSAITKQVKNSVKIPYSEIKNFHIPSVEGHSGELVIGNIEDSNVAILSGRLHYYEGISIQDVVFPSRILSAMNPKAIIITNASGGINENYKPGDIVLITDHINMTGTNPLIGKNDNRLGVRFPDMSNTYSVKLQNLVKEVAKDIAYNLKTGVYAGVIGPSFETPAEVRALKNLGADMVGMSTVPEVIAISHMNIDIIGLSCISNISSKKCNHQEVQKNVTNNIDILSSLIKGIVKRLNNI